MSPASIWSATSSVSAVERWYGSLDQYLPRMEERAQQERLVEALRWAHVPDARQPARL